MNIVKRKLSELKQAEKNLRMHPDKQINEYVRSLEKNGQLKPIVIDENNVIWIGNGLHQAMIKAGYTEAYCLLKEGMTEKDKKKMMASDNRIFDLGVDDMSVFDEFILEFKDDLDVPGFDEDLLKSLIADAEEVDDMMSSYGLVGEEKKAEITAAKETYEKQEEAFAQNAQNGAPQPEYSPASENTSEEVGRYVVCPKCGEKIWL